MTQARICPECSMDYVEGKDLGEVILDLRAAPLDWKCMASRKPLHPDC